jgi:hypothetical protein
LVKDISSLLETSSGNSPAACNNEVIIATHSDLTLTDADPQQVYIFAESEVELKDGSKMKRIKVGNPAISPFAASRGDISNELFQTPAAIGTYSKELIENALSQGDKAEIERVLKAVGPGFYRFRLRERLIQLEEKGQQGGA